MIPIGGRTSLLTISSVRPDHAGDYVCSAVNEAGETTHTATLFINGIRRKSLFIIVVVPLREPPGINNMT